MKKLKQTVKQNQMGIFTILFIGIFICAIFGGRALGWWGATIEDTAGGGSYIPPTTPTAPYIPPTPTAPEPITPEPEVPPEPPYIPPTPEDPDPTLPEIIFDEDGNIIVIIPEDPEPEPETTESISPNIFIIAGIIILVFGSIVVSMNRRKK